MRQTLFGLLVAGAILVAAIWTRGAMPAGHHAHAAMATIDLAGFLTLGLLGGFGHCVGMCSPFVLFVARRPGTAPGTAPTLTPQLWYTAGRIATYAALGAVAGALGGAIELTGGLLGMRRTATVVAGVVLVAWALAEMGSGAISRPGSGRSPRSHHDGISLFTRIAAGARNRLPAHPFATGLFLGFLPCGLLYSAVIAAVARGGALAGATALVLFGLGTTPALLGVSLADELLARRRALVNRLSQLFILAMGGWFLWKALI